MPNFPAPTARFRLFLAMSWGKKGSEASSSPRRSTPRGLEAAELLRQLQRKEADATRLTERVQRLGEWFNGSEKPRKALDVLQFPSIFHHLPWFPVDFDPFCSPFEGFSQWPF